MNEKQLKEFFTAVDTLAEMSPLFHRSSVAAKATPEEAMRITQASTVAALSRGRSDNKEGA